MTVSAIRAASEEELVEVEGIGPALAAHIVAALRSEQGDDTQAVDGDGELAVAVDMATGEILDR